jgi:hypothetical protein
MKKLLSILCVSIIALTAASCKKETNIAPSRAFFEDVNTWVRTIDDNGNYTYTADVPLAEIDDYYDSRGAVIIYNDLGDGNYELLPRVYNGITYSPTYTFGHVYIDAQSATGIGAFDPPPALHLKIVLVD